MRCPGGVWGRGRQEENRLLQRESPLPKRSPPSLPSAFIPVLKERMGSVDRDGGFPMGTTQHHHWPHWSRRRGSGDVFSQFSFSHSSCQLVPPSQPEEGDAHNPLHPTSSQAPSAANGETGPGAPAGEPAQPWDPTQPSTIAKLQAQT